MHLYIVQITGPLTNHIQAEILEVAPVVVRKRVINNFPLP